MRAAGSSCCSSSGSPCSPAAATSRPTSRPATRSRSAPASAGSTSAATTRPRRRSVLRDGLDGRAAYAVHGRRQRPHDAGASPAGRSRRRLHGLRARRRSRSGAGRPRGCGPTTPAATSSTRSSSSTSRASPPWSTASTGPTAAPRRTASVDLPPRRLRRRPAAGRPRRSTLQGSRGRRSGTPTSATTLGCSYRWWRRRPAIDAAAVHRFVARLRQPGDGLGGDPAARSGHGAAAALVVRQPARRRRRRGTGCAHGPCPGAGPVVTDRLGGRPADAPRDATVALVDGRPHVVRARPGMVFAPERPRDGAGRRDPRARPDGRVRATREPAVVHERGCARARHPPTRSRRPPSTCRAGRTPTGWCPPPPGSTARWSSPATACRCATGSVATSPATRRRPSSRPRPSTPPGSVGSSSAPTPPCRPTPATTRWAATRPCATGRTSPSPTTRRTACWSRWRPCDRPRRTTARSPSASGRRHAGRSPRATAPRTTSSRPGASCTAARAVTARPATTASTSPSPAPSRTPARATPTTARRTPCTTRRCRPSSASGTALRASRQPDVRSSSCSRSCAASSTSLCRHSDAR